jgi:hypothetical protein
MKHEKPVTDRRSSRSEAPVSVAAASDDTAADSLVTRTEAASLLGASVSTLRRRDQELRPIVDEDGIHHGISRTRLEGARFLHSHLSCLG